MYWIFATLYTFLTILISQLLEREVKIVFYLVMILLFFSINNIYFSILYYIKLRNNKGIKGERGDPGLSGQDGSNGVCIMSKGCNIINCEKLIKDRITKIYPDYKDIMIKSENNLKLTELENNKIKKINSFIQQLINRCEKYELEAGKSVEKFIELIDEKFKSITN